MACSREKQPGRYAADGDGRCIRAIAVIDTNAVATILVSSASASISARTAENKEDVKRS
jgi:hypothetical protein